MVGPTFTWDFMTNQAMAPWMQFSRGGTAGSVGCFDSTGTWVALGTQSPCFDHDLNGNLLGLRQEETRTNVVLWDRDLTNAAWTATNVTVAKDQTGIDGVSSSSSSLTATAGNGTVCQSITLGSSARYETAFVKRITGTGTIQMSMDNSTYTTIAITNPWARYNIPTQTLANPTVCFKIVTSGDAIAVDFVQNENGIFQTTPILTTTVSVNRPVDFPSFYANQVIGQGPATYIWEGIINTSANSSNIFIDFAAPNDTLLYANVTGPNFYSNSSAHGALSSGSAVHAGSVDRAGVAWDYNGRSISANGSVPTFDAFALGTSPFFLFGGQNGSRCHQKVAIYNYRMRDPILQSKTVIGAPF